MGVHRNTAALYFRKLRELIARHQEREMRQPFAGEVEIDESYFGGNRKGKRGRGTAGKVAVYGLLKRGGKVYTQMIADCKRDSLLPIIRQRITPDSVVYPDTFVSYSTLSAEGYHRVRINPDTSLAQPDGRHINGIENFWIPGQASPASVQRRAQRELLPVPQRVRVALQRQKRREPS